MPNRAHRRAHRGHTTTHRPADAPVPILPGVLPDLTDESQQRAMDQAHEDLPHIPGTQVRIFIVPLDDGPDRLRELGYTPAQIDRWLEHVATVAGDDPHMVLSTRMPR